MLGLEPKNWRANFLFPTFEQEAAERLSAMPPGRPTDFKALSERVILISTMYPFSSLCLVLLCTAPRYVLSSFLSFSYFVIYFTYLSPSPLCGPSFFNSLFTTQLPSALPLLPISFALVPHHTHSGFLPLISHPMTTLSSSPRAKRMQLSRSFVSLPSIVRTLSSACSAACFPHAILLCHLPIDCHPLIDAKRDVTIMGRELRVLAQSLKMEQLKSLPAGALVVAHWLQGERERIAICRFLQWTPAGDRLLVHNGVCAYVCVRVCGSEQ